MEWNAKLITSQNETNKAYPVYWNLTDGNLRLTINIYKADKLTLNEAKVKVKALIKKLNS